MRPTTEPGMTPAWHKSSHSSSSGNCVEIATFGGDRIAVRDSKAPEGPTVTPPIGSFAKFVRAVGEGRIVR